MVCNRCKMVVKSELEKFGLHPLAVELGDVTLAEELDKEQLKEVEIGLQSYGFELIDDKKSRLTEKIKNLIIELVHTNNNHLIHNLSAYITEQIGQDYSTLSKLFSQQEGTTIEQYFILQKIERVKELLIYDELNLNEIAFQLNYSSTSHLSKQFKKVTGLTPTLFKQSTTVKRNSLENL